MAFYFFTEPNLLSTQGGGTAINTDAFGPVHFENEYSNLKNEKYNVTSTHHALEDSTFLAENKLLNQNPSLYAPCDCTVFVTPINEIKNGVSTPNTNFVNLILKPSEQPSFKFPKIKYFIFRNVLKSSFLDANMSVVSNKSINATDYTKSINNNANQPDGAQPTRLGDFGDLPLPANTPIENLFNNKVFDFTLQNIFGGKLLGKFSKKRFEPIGLEIVLDEIGENLTLGDIRDIQILPDNLLSKYNPDINKSPDINKYKLTLSNRKIIDVGSYSEYDSNAVKFLRKKKREEVLIYADPAAFYGSFIFSDNKGLNSWPLGCYFFKSIDYEEISKVDDKSPHELRKLDLYPPIEIPKLPNGDFPPMYTDSNFIGDYRELFIKKPLNHWEKYIKILKGSHFKTNTNYQIFLNSNRIYIDIRNELGTSFNFFGNYVNGGDNTNISESPKFKLNDSQDDIYRDLQGESWPIMILDQNINFAQTGTLKNIPKNGDNFKFDLKLPRDLSQLEPEHSLYLQYDSFFLSENKNKKNIQNFNLLRLDIEKVQNGFLSNFLEPISLIFPGQSSQVCAGFVKMMLIRHDTEYLVTDKNIVLPARTSQNEPEFKSPSTINYYDDKSNTNLLPNSRKLPKKSEYLDNIWIPFDTPLNFSNESNVVQIKVFEKAAYVDNTSTGGNDFVANVGIAKTNDGYTLFAFSDDKYYKEPYTSADSIIPESFQESDLIYPCYEEDINELITDLNITTLKSPWSESFFQYLYSTKLFNNRNVYLKEFTDLSQNISVKEICSINNLPIAITTNFVSLNLSNSIWDSLKLIRENIGFISSLQVYLGVKLTGITSRPGFPDEKIQIYEYILRGFVQDGNDVNLTDINTGLFFNAVKPTLDIKLFNNKTIGLSGEVTPNEINNYSDIYKVNSTIYLLKGNDITPLQFNEMANHIVKNIREVFTTSINYGLTAKLKGELPHDGIYNDLSSDINFPQPLQHYEINSFNSIGNKDGINVRVITPRHLFSLNNKECYAVINLEPGRDFALPSKKAMIFYWKKRASYSQIYEPQDYDITPAHEFGHLLGLADRYTYCVSFGLTGEIKDEIQGQTSKNIPVYIYDSCYPNSFDLQSFDIEYSREYRWKYNLFSGGIVESSISESVFGSEKSFQEAMKPSNLAIGALPSFTYNFTNGNFSVFITKFQFDSIIKFSSSLYSKTNEKDLALLNSNGLNYRDFLFFLGTDNFNTSALPTFISFDENSGNGYGNVVNDFYFNPNSSNINNNDHNMEYRKSSIPLNDNNFKFWYSPYTGILNFSRNRNIIGNPVKELALEIGINFSDLIAQIESSPISNRHIVLTFSEVYSFFNEYGESDQFEKGRIIWNKVFNGLFTKSFIYRFKGFEYVITANYTKKFGNRLKIIELISLGQINKF